MIGYKKAPDWIHSSRSVLFLINAVGTPVGEGVLGGGNEVELDVDEVLRFFLLESQGHDAALSVGDLCYLHRGPSGLHDSEIACGGTAEVDGEATRVGASVGDLDDDGLAVAHVGHAQPCAQGIAPMGAGEAVLVIDVTVGHAPAVELVVVVRCHTPFRPQSQAEACEQTTGYCPDDYSCVSHYFT